jgi:hypothetical protein
VFAGEVTKDEADLVAAQDGGDAANASGAGGGEMRLDRQAESGAVEKEDGTESLVLRGGGDPIVDGEMAEEGFDLAFAQAGRVSVLVKCEEAVDPEQVALLGAERVMFAAKDGAGAVENPKWRGLHSGCPPGCGAGGSLSRVTTESRYPFLLVLCASSSIEGHPQG